MFRRALACILVLSVSGVGAQALASDRQADLPNLVFKLNGSPQFLGTVVATTTKNNSDTASPFTIAAGSALLVRCDASAYVLAGTATTSTVTTTNGVPLDSGEKFYLTLKAGEAYVAFLSASGTANCKVWRME